MGEIENHTSMKKRLATITALTTVCLVLTTAGCSKRGEHGIDALHRSRADALTKAAFKNRMHDAEKSIYYSQKALRYIDDSLPAYNDGRLRALNTMATAYLSLSQHDSASHYADSVINSTARSTNSKIERQIARLVKANILQRDCNISGSYLTLYDIEQSNLTSHAGESMLYNLAISEFYITTTTLNYHYRSKSQYQQAELMSEIEQHRTQLRCDYDEDMSLNYAIAYGYYSLCNDTVQQALHLNKALRYCHENLFLLNDSVRYSSHHLANTYQLIGLMLWNTRITATSRQYNQPLLDSICLFVGDAFGFDLSETKDTALAFLSEATSLSWLTDNPYQKLGAIVSTGRYCMTVGDTALARSYFTEALVDTTLLGVAPKFEAMLYEGFLTSGCAQSNNEVKEWTSRELSLLNRIKENEREDFMLQIELDRMHDNSRTFMLFTLALLTLSAVLIATLFKLRRRTRRLQEETRKLQEAQQRDIERIANVETCLSVLRHDITPFISYLQNDSLPAEIKHDVTNQLICTFENIKNWTNLSLPFGLQFRSTDVNMQHIFDNVEASINNYRPGTVALHFQPTGIVVRGDRHLLEIMLRNLVNNAIQHTEQGTITVSAGIDNDDPRFAHMAVSDTGSGMSGDELESLFRADKKIHAAEDGKGYGSGFGLILCRYIIKKHDDNTLRGCRIWAESTLGQGTTMHCRIAMAPKNQQ